VNKSIKYSPRSSALLAVFCTAAKLRSNISIEEDLNSWFASFPEDLSEYFSDSFRELIANPQRTIAEIENIKISASEITDVLAKYLLEEDNQFIAKRRGAIFTPIWLARKVTKDALQNWRRLHRGGSEPKLVADVSCGPGAFLCAIQENFGKETKIFGSDIDFNSCMYARLIAFTFGYNWDIQRQDTLLNEALPQLLVPQQNARPDVKYDILMGNPPFVRSPSLDPEYLKNIRYYYSSTSNGNFDLSVAFIEHAINHLSEGGIASYILTHKFMTMAYGEKICRQLANNVRILSIEDFQDYQLFHGYTTYTCVLTLANIPPAKRFHVIRYPQGISDKGDPGAGTAASLPLERLMKHPWDFATDDIHSILRVLRNPKHPLIEEVFSEIIQGLRTGANHVFVVPFSRAKDIESDLLLPFINGEHVRRCKINTDSFRLLFPYTFDEFGKAVILSEDELKSRFPKGWKYLNNNYPSLIDRSRDNNLPWYAFSRSQNLELGRLRKIFIKEMMPRAEFAADDSGNVTFASGYALNGLRMSDEQLKMWSAILSTPTMEFALRHSGTQLQSGWFRLLKHHLMRIRLPQLNNEHLAIAMKQALKLYARPDDIGRLGDLDKTISSAFGLSEKQRIIIAKYLADCHNRSLGRSRSKETETIFSDSVVDSNLYEPVRLDEYTHLHRDRHDLNKAVTFVTNKSAPIHRWYKYTQGYSALLVEALLNELAVTPKQCVLDPFTGCGTTNLVCLQHGIRSIGLDISPLMTWIAKVKTHPWNSSDLIRLMRKVYLPSPSKCKSRKYEESIFIDYLSKAFSPNILNQLWSFAEVFESEVPRKYRDFFKMGLLSIMEDVSQIRKHGSHYRYMLKNESIGLQKLNTQIIPPDTDVRELLMKRMMEMIEDVISSRIINKNVSCEILTGDARNNALPSNSCDVVITSPPYLNRNNYIAQQKAELALLSMIDNKKSYRELVLSTLRSHVEARFSGNEIKTDLSEIRIILETLHLTRNNNPKIPHMIAGYFVDIEIVLKELFRVLRKGGKMAFVVGNSRWGGVVIPVDHLLIMIGEKIGFIPEKILVTRLKGNSPQQMRQYGRIPVRESIIILRKP